MIEYIIAGVVVLAVLVLIIYVLSSDKGRRGTVLALVAAGRPN